MYAILFSSGEHDEWEIKRVYVVDGPTYDKFVEMKKQMRAEEIPLIKATYTDGLSVDEKRAVYQKLRALQMVWDNKLSGLLGAFRVEEAYHHMVHREEQG
jgi:hypothetical protein